MFLPFVSGRQPADGIVVPEYVGRPIAGWKSRQTDLRMDSEISSRDKMLTFYVWNYFGLNGNNLYPQ